MAHVTALFWRTAHIRHLLRLTVLHYVKDMVGYPFTSFT